MISRIVCAVLVAGVLLAVPGRAASQTSPVAISQTERIARNLADNILGEGSVKSVREIDRGRGLAMVWESATFRAHHSPNQTRELLQVEVELALGAIFQILRQIERIQFQILQGKRQLASGEASRAQPLRMQFARELGG
jgi:hypothetical protein